MRTISRRWPRSAPRGDFQALCDVCGVNWQRSKMTRKADGTLVCPDDAPGLDVVTLAEGNAEAQRFRHYGNLTRDGANYNKDTVTAIPSPTTNKGSSFT